ncbi:lytic transglycosylase domain-containing protein [Thioclava sp. FR2]|uniref:lytic transglycosylase domain-containing protein n=1 Tax=Thioclava sp. FR2 TaxID=3445780 RepID=UPI003EB7256F
MRLKLLFIAFFALPSTGIAARQNDACDQAAMSAAERTGVPARLLMAIARTEAGRQQDGVFSPWPWTVNEAGSGSFFPTRKDAETHVQSALASGSRNIDVGCFQINVRWHGQAFSSVSSMFDPEKNAFYAASFLKQLLQETGSWEGAVGAYHSRLEEAATSYVAKVKEHLDHPAEIAAPTIFRAATPLRTNTYPLLHGGGGSMGSLVRREARAAISSLLR